VWYDHLPYLKFPDNWPVFAPKDKIADWLEFYTKVMEIPYWSSTTATSATYDDETGQWTVDVDRDGEAVTLRPTHLVMATGMSGKPNIPTFPGADVFKGEQQHSSQHPGPDAYAGKKVVVIGSNNSAFDICGALYENDADVTMVQRSSTHIVKSDSLMEIGLGDLYSERALANGVTTEKADLIFASLPYRIMHEFQIPLYDQMKERDKDFYQRMEDAGFDLDFGDDESGLFLKYLRRGSGYYIDVGSAELVADGKVKLAKGQVDHLTEDAVVLDDGTELPADLIVYATGYGSMNGWVADLVDQETADKVGKCWGLGSETTKDPGPWEGEQRNMWKPDPAGEPVVPWAAIFTSRGTTRSTWPCSSRPGTKASTLRCTGCRRSTTSSEIRHPKAGDEACVSAERRPHPVPESSAAGPASRERSSHARAPLPG
jgi:putative flavoprotein involved in K+ transport